MNYDAVIFDLDGTLLESTADHLEWLYTAVEQALEKTGQEKMVTELSHQELGVLAGIKGYSKFEKKCSELELDDRELWFHVSHLRAREKLDLLEEDLLHLVDGTEDVLETLRRDNLKLAVVSNAPDSTVDEVIRYFNLTSKLDFFRGITDLEDLKERKPHSFHLELAVDELKAENCIYVGDSHVDIVAAEKLGLDSVIIGESEKATFEIDELSDLRKVFSGNLEQDQVYGV